MISLSPFMIRSLALFVPLVAVGLLWLWREPGLRLATAALLACAWTVPALLFLNLLAIEVGWWHFEAQGGVFMGLPVDLLLGWVLLWGALPILAFPHLQWPLMLALMLLLDVMFMPLMAPVLQLGQYWLVGELLVLLFCLLPAQLLARWTMQDEQLTARVLLLGIGYSGLLFGVLPLIILDATGGGGQAFLLTGNSNTENRPHPPAPSTCDRLWRPNNRRGGEKRLAPPSPIIGTPKAIASRGGLGGGGRFSGGGSVFRAPAVAQ